jgi:hypothetical protein
MAATGAAVGAAIAAAAYWISVDGTAPGSVPAKSEGTATTQASDATIRPSPAGEGAGDSPQLPTVTATATVDQNRAAALRTVAEILDSVAAAEEIALELGTMQSLNWNGGAEGVNSAYSQFLFTCRSGRLHLAGMFDDLWPRPYQEVVDKAQFACYVAEEFEKDRTQERWQVTVYALQSGALPDLIAALDTLPDYSDAQLLRVVQDRQ